MTTEQPKGCRIPTASNMQISLDFMAMLFYSCGLNRYTYFWTVTPGERTAAGCKTNTQFYYDELSQLSKKACQSENT